MCTKSEYFLKDVPAIAEETVHHIDTKLGKQESVELQHTKIISIKIQSVTKQKKC